MVDDLRQYDPPDVQIGTNYTDTVTLTSGLCTCLFAPNDGDTWMAGITFRTDDSDGTAWNSTLIVEAERLIQVPS